jgi:Zn-dependent protease with chaperone function
MDFFAAQEEAHKRSRWLLVGFGLCVLGVIVTVFAVAVQIKPFFVESRFEEIGLSILGPWWDPQLLAWVAATVGGTIVIGSAYKQSRLSGGGSVVARDLGGRPVSPGTSDPLEKRLINVVEEMAIASGVPVPQVWILDEEPGINAFAAGTDAANAVIGVTRGCLELLKRSELQGVVAHEFSHILNGDMRLNQRLIGWVFGLMMVAMAGRAILYSLRRVRVRSSGNSRSSGGFLAILLAAGLTLWIVGSLGSLFARLLQAAFSRQREFLADAAAVQFTREPSGIAGALKKIGGHSGNGVLSSGEAGEARHLFFAASDFFRLGLSTHPPLPERIRRIDPSWDGEMVLPDKRDVLSDGAPGKRSGPPPLPQVNNLGFAERIQPAVGAVVRDLLHSQQKRIASELDARAVLFGLLVVPDAVAYQDPLECLERAFGKDMVEQTLDWSRRLRSLPSVQKIAFMDLALPWLRQIGAEGAREVVDLTRVFIHADHSVSLFEFMLQKVIERQVAIGTGLRQPAPVRHASLRQVRFEVASLLHAFAQASGHPESLTAAAEEFCDHAGEPILPAPEQPVLLEKVGAALDELEATTPAVKSVVLRLAARIVLQDGRISEEELELLRAAADAMGAPIPPLVRFTGLETARS